MSAPSVFLLTAHCLDPPLSRKCASPSEHGLGCFRDSSSSANLRSPSLLSCLESYGPSLVRQCPRSVPRGLAFRKGDILTVIEQNTGGLEGWWLCSLARPAGHCPRQPGEASDWPSAGRPPPIRTLPTSGLGPPFGQQKLYQIPNPQAPETPSTKCRLPTKIREFTKSPPVSGLGADVSSAHPQGREALGKNAVPT